MTKFNVGDKVRFIEDYMDYKKGDIVEVEGFWSEGINYIGKGKLTGCYFSRVELVEPKLTKNQRITALENEVAELKLIVHELRERPQLTTVINNSIQGPSTTNTVEDIIEFEGANYRKVDRQASEGDVVMQDVEHSAWMEKGHFYRVLSEGKVLIKNGVETLLYTGWNGRTVDTVNVYELIESKPLTPNQQRAAIVEKAKSFVEETEKYLKQPQADRTKGNYLYQESSNIVKFVINEEKRTIVALLYDKYLENKLNGKGIAKCNPSDVFNEHIGKAIALGRALGLDVSEFEQAVQPTLAIGQIVYETEDKTYRTIAESGVYSEESMLTSINSRSAKELSVIINDTDAIYGGVE